MEKEPVEVLETDNTVPMQNGTALPLSLPKYFVGFVCKTAGQDKENLGNDEAEIVFLGWAVVDTTNVKVMAVHHSFVQPRDLEKVNWELLKERNVDEELIKSAPNLEEALQKFESYAATQLSGAQTPLIFVTDGPMSIRQVLFPECTRKEMSLPAHYALYLDIRKAYRRLLNNNENLNTLDDIMNCKVLK